MNHQIKWQPSANVAVLRERAEFMRRLRAFFVERAYLEVETPVLARYGVTDPYLKNIQTEFQGKPYFLQTSPEYHMKRLLAAGSGPIFQLSRVFRDDEWGRWHNPEFTLLEWYQLGLDHIQMMDEVDCLLQQFFSCGPMIRMTYQEAFIEYCALDPLQASIFDLKNALVRFSLQGILPDEETSLDQYLFLLMSHVIEPALGSQALPVALFDFPASQASLAKIEHGTANRFEVYYRGVELANGFHELTDAKLQRERFSVDAKARRDMGLQEMAPDEYLLEALSHGLPSCAGVALGIDRFFTLASDMKEIAQTLAFDFSRA